LPEAATTTVGTIHVTLVTPFGTQQEYDIRHLRAPGVEGEFGVLPGHIPFLTPLRIGALHLDSDDGRRTWAVSGGYFEIIDDRAVILAETAEPAPSIDLERAEAARRRALERLQLAAEGVDNERARASLARAVNRLGVGRGS